MQNKNVKVKFLPVTRWKELRDLRLKSLKEEPLAFGSNFMEEKKSPKKKFVDRLKKKQIVFAELDGDLVGMLGFRTNNKERIGHIAEIGPLYVCKDYRRRGIGSLLLKEIIALAEKKKMKKLQLKVNISSHAAISVYKKFGFRKVGRLKKEIKINGKYYDALMLEKQLN